MTTTTSIVTYSGEAAKLLRESCKKAEAEGGSYSITDRYTPGQCWMTEFVINWPEPKKQTP